MAVEFYGGRHIHMRMFNNKEKQEIIRLKSMGFLYICKDDTYHPVKAFKREPALKFMNKERTSFIFSLSPKTGETMDDIVVDYNTIEGMSNLFLRSLKIGEMLDLTVMVIFDCIHYKQEEEIKKIELEY